MSLTQVRHSPRSELALNCKSEIGRDINHHIYFLFFFNITVTFELHKVFKKLFTRQNKHSFALGLKFNYVNDLVPLQRCLHTHCSSCQLQTDSDTMQLWIQIVSEPRKGRHSIVLHLVRKWLYFTLTHSTPGTDISVPIFHPYLTRHGYIRTGQCPHCKRSHSGLNLHTVKFVSSTHFLYFPQT